MSKCDCDKPEHAVLEDGVVIGVGGRKCNYERHQTIMCFGSIAERETWEPVQSWRRARVNAKNARLVESEKTNDEYAGKAENALRFIAQDHADDFGDYSEKAYPWMSLEINAKNLTPKECAESIESAIMLSEGDLIGPFERARRRIELRESLLNDDAS